MIYNKEILKECIVDDITEMKMNLIYNMTIDTILFGDYIKVNFNNKLYDINLFVLIHIDDYNKKLIKNRQLKLNSL